jgi:DNA helicase-2/ATP-dependent DNA helicase PcrA
VRHLLNSGVFAEKITVLTFSKAAALNMAHRLEKQFDVGGVECLTTHAFGLKIIMDHWLDLGFSACPKVMIKQSGRQLGFIIKKVAASNKVDFKKLLNDAKAANKDGKSGQAGQGKGIMSKSVAEVLMRYQKSKLRKNWVDFADMLDLPTQLLKDNPDILKKVGLGIAHLLVDEVQDMKDKECQLLYYLAKHSKSAVLVGDKKQNIYKFRGADPSCLRKLEKYLKPVEYHLTESFRLPFKMLALVNAIGADINDDPKLTSSRQGYSPQFFRSANNDEQSEFIVRKVQSLLARGVMANEIAILGRTRRHLIMVKNALTQNGIASVETYCGSKGLPVKLLKALIWIAKWKAKAPKRGKHPFKPVNALTRVLKTSGLPKLTQEVLHEAICDEGWDLLHAPKKEHGDTVYRKILALRRAVAAAATLCPESGVQLLIDAIKPFLANKFGKNEKLIVVRDYSLIKTAVRGCMTWADVRVKELPVTYNNSGVELSTCHGAKGREWRYVFMINVVDGEFPFYFKEVDVKLDEELRLFYVAVSRSSKQLFIIESPVHKNNYAKGSKKYPTNLELKSTFVADYGSKLKSIK